MDDIVINPCECAPVPEWLLESGVFPCAPLRPSLAVDVRLLEFTMKLFVRIAPNKSALTGALVAHLGDLGFKLASQDAMRRQFTAALEWYTYLRHRVDAHLDGVLELTRESARAPDAEVEEGASGRQGPPEPEPDEARVDSTSHGRAQSPARPEGGRDRGRRPAMPPSSPTPPTPQRGRSKGGNKRKRRESPETPETPEAESNPFPDPPPRSRPSDYLRARCPACFGGDKYGPEDFANIKVCVDACFTQKKNKSAPDPPKHHPGTHFVGEDVSDRMETYVDAVRESRTSKRQRKRARADENVAVVNSDDEEDGYEHSELPLPRSVLRSCEASFKAADEKRAKASTKLHDDTGLMALLCRHDRVLWVVNMHSAGEKQFYVLLLIETLFQHLPLTTTVGLLYDIACQLERSARKWGFLDRYLQRLIFAVAVFHAFGHDWPCQLVYHPRKREGFGFTNGEGCERLWESISHLIAHLRVSSYHHRLYTLDTQVKHADENSLFRLAEWNKRRSVHSAGKRSDAMLVLEECEVTVEVLRGEWEKQVKAQTKPLARRSKNLVQKAVEQILSLRDAVKIRKSQVQAAESAALQAIEDEDGDAIQETKTEVKKAKAALREAETKLKKKEGALGVKERARLTKVGASKYYDVRMRCRALKHRLRDRLRARKFELDRVERSARHHRGRANEKKLGAHAEVAIKRRDPGIATLYKEYNKLCAQIRTMIQNRTAPRKVIAPQVIDPKKVWQLDVDDDIWQDVGLDDDDDDDGAAGSSEPPLWLSNESVRSGILAMLDVDRADEEDRELEKERRAMQVWFAEEWEVVNLALEEAGMCF
ncbi:hypothetical protein B0H11DRAFT_1749743 [Mycena galericulata]|nr:hypothetical protein B0H11DRAFT_1761646 [Mycena galericulata]KAJ7441445.1 hypothetical protein B0H11DRAFT_1749743 [Mycena galericulata]